MNESSWELTEKWVNSIPGDQEWRVQPVPSDKFIGKQIERITFEVQSHPLNNRFDKVNVTVFLYERKVIGGLSYPVPDYDGAPYSLDGE
ncbi:hypothetical protein [Bacillus sp. SG-1]|uniref:hypothetical protein n=1 Tax=Bacillus sp. SG-1 TaxID=161544 RepID=UPI0002EBBEF5|nr:hypothetical protein [Bacillus sp. SG-1]